MLNVPLSYLGTCLFSLVAQNFFCKDRYLLIKIPGVFSPPSYSVGKDVEVYTHHNKLVSLLP